MYLNVAYLDVESFRIGRRPSRPEARYGGGFVVSQGDSVLKLTSSVSRSDERKPLSHNEIRRSRIQLGENGIGQQPCLRCHRTPPIRRNYNLTPHRGWDRVV